MLTNLPILYLDRLEVQPTISIYLVDGDNYLYSRKKKKSDGEFGRHLWLCIEKNCSSSASTLSKEGADTKIVAFGSKKHQHVSNHAKVTMIFFFVQK